MSGENGAREVRVTIRATTEEIGKAAAAGASWADLARLIGITDRTLRTWRTMRDQRAHNSIFPPSPQDEAMAAVLQKGQDLYLELSGVKKVEKSDARPRQEVPDVIVEVLDAIDAGRARGKREILDALLEIGKGGDARTLIYLLKRLDGFDADG